MADPIGVAASLIAIAGLAVKITHQLDQMIERHHDAPAVFKAFRSNFDSARRILDILSKTLRDFEVNESIHGLDFEAQLRESMTAIKDTLDNVWERLASVRRLRKPDAWRFWERMMVVWDEEQLDKWDKILDRQVNHLNGLLNAQSHYRAHLEKARQNPTAARNWIESSAPPTPTDSGTLVLDSDGSLQATAEAGLAGLATLPESQADGKIKSMLPGKDAAQRALDSLKSRAGALVEGHPDMKFRILLMGKQNNGKSTLCNKVLGIKLNEPSSLFGDSTPFDNIHKEQTFAGINPDLIIHDSGGFENGGNEATKALESFLDKRHRDEEAEIDQRIHCIWYVIACNNSKPIHPIDETFLRNHFQVSKIPVFIVVTKYDRIIDDLKEDAVDSGKDVDKSIEKKAYEIFKKLTLDPLHSLAREAREEHGMDVEICTVGFRKRGREFLPTHFTPPGLKHWGSAQLVSLMRKKLSPELRPLLAAVQVTDPRNKLEEAVDACTKLYWSAIVVKSVPILPFLTVGSLATVYLFTMKKAQRIWKIETEEGFRISSLEGEITNLIIKSIFNIKTVTGMAFLSAARVADITGVLAASKLARDLVTIVVGLNALLHGFWLVQHRNGAEPEPLSLEQVQKVCRDFQSSMWQRQMAREIDAINYTNMYRRREVAAIAMRAWKASIGEEVPTLRRTERQRREERAQYDAL